MEQWDNSCIMLDNEHFSSFNRLACRRHSKHGWARNGYVRSADRHIETCAGNLPLLLFRFFFYPPSFFCS